MNNRQKENRPPITMTKPDKLIQFCSRDGRCGGFPAFSSFINRNIGQVAVARICPDLRLSVVPQEDNPAAGCAGIFNPAPPDSFRSFETTNSAAALHDRTIHPATAAGSITS